MTIFVDIILKMISKFDVTHICYFNICFEVLNMVVYFFQLTVNKRISTAVVSVLFGVLDTSYYNHKLYSLQTMKVKRGYIIGRSILSNLDLVNSLAPGRF